MINAGNWMKMVEFGTAMGYKKFFCQDSRIQRFKDSKFKIVG
jgi:hypothetical protein